MNTPHQAVESTDQYLQYRAVSLSAVTTLILAIVSLPALVFAKLLVLPAIGLALGLYSVVKVGRRRDEFVGLNLARAGVVLCAVVLQCLHVREQQVACVRRITFLRPR